jgi:hypothetical protein
MTERLAGPPMINAFDAGRIDTLPEATQALIRRRARVMGASYRLFYEAPVHLDRAEGVWLFDPDGTPYLDCYNNVPCVGHCHPRVVDAVRDQMGRLNTHTRYLTDTVVDYAERLVATFPTALSQVMLTCTGSEAIDLALRIARFTTGAAGVIVTENAYHGVTAAAAEASPSLGAGVPLGPHVRTVRRRRCCSTRSFPATGFAPIRRDSFCLRSRLFVRLAASSSLTRCSPALPEPVRRCGGFCGMAPSRIWWCSASRWGTAFRSPVSSGGRICSTISRPGRGISIPSGATR